MTINGVKKFLNSNEPIMLDEMSNNSIKALNVRNKVIKISNLIKVIKKFRNGKKNTR